MDKYLDMGFAEDVWRWVVSPPGRDALRRSGLWCVGRDYLGLAMRTRRMSWLGISRGMLLVSVTSSPVQRFLAC